jgi:hypothetical protein
VNGAPAKRKKRKTRRRTTGEEVACPFCGEREALHVDEGGGQHQTYVEDCAVCCRPRVVHVEPGSEPGQVHVWLERGD